MLTAVSESHRRKYALLKITAGDYLLPGNDGRTLWRLHSYFEDGSASWVDADGSERIIRGTFWQLLRYRGTVEAAAEDEDLTEWTDRWEEADSLLRSRAEAIQAVMATTERQAP